jgi:hypothetical protein
MDQYETHLPTELVWVHVTLASCAWLAAIWAACAVGAMGLRRRSALSSSSPAASLRGATTLEKGVA